MNDAQRFLEALLKGKPEGLLALLWTLHDKKSRWITSLAEALTLSKSLCKRDLYIGVGLSPRDFGPSSRCKSEEIAGIFGLWADIDVSSVAHTKKPLPATIEDALSLIPDEMPPTLIVLSGNGLHLWWLFEEPYVFASDADRKRGAALAFRWQTLIAHRGSTKGWAIERLADLARVLRIPGTMNTKDKQNPKPVTIHSQSKRRYKLNEFTQYLDSCGIGDLDGDKRAAAALVRCCDDVEFSINPEATVPADVLEQHLGSDMRFRNTWNKQRHDLADKSQSGYDLALADFGVKVGMNPQQIADMIVHHRRLHGSARSNSLDYYRRTFSKAENKSAGRTITATGIHPSDCGTGSPLATLGGGPVDEPMHKAALCDRISTVVGVRVIRILKLTAKEPVYFVDLEQGRVEFPGVRTLITYKTFRETIAAKTNKLIPPFSKKAWEQLAQTILEACVDIDGTEELQLEGEARSYVEQYLSETVISSLDVAAGGLQRPVIRDERILISAVDLQMFINKTTMQALSVRQVAAMLAALGAKGFRFRGGTFREQSRWALPVDAFDPKDYISAEGV